MMQAGEAERGAGLAAGAGGLLDEVLRGLSAPRKALSPKWLYDARGSALYELICEQPEYYPARTERAILEAHVQEIAAAVGPRVEVFEFGAGSARKTARLLAALEAPAAYLPVDISPEAVLAAAEALRARFPRLPVRPVVGDFTNGVELPATPGDPSRRLAFFPGSTIGNFDPPEAVALLRKMAVEAGPDGGLLIGVDHPKDRVTLEAAYDDARGVTAAFDLNLLARLNRELGADFRLSGFRHRSLWNERCGRVEMHLESLEPQAVTVGGLRFAFRQGETLHTESAYKWEPRAFDALAAIGGWRPERSWSDARAWFSLRLYRRAG
ncbi:MAG: L-histidine N(alpha)-methyltransferase [Anaeromyxobacter sp.]